jgi:ribosomal protein L11 methyltransferase
VDANGVAGASPPATIVRLVVPAEAAELAADALWQHRPSAVLEEPWSDGQVRLTADVHDVLGVGELGERWPLERLEVDGDAYLDAWRAWARPVRAGARFVLVPSWLTGDASMVAPDDLTIVLDPGRAFGSGSHPSTRLVLALMEDLVRPGATVLDVGTGSGVLAVGACLLGAASVVAIDVDPVAVTATTGNAEANGVADRIAVATTPVAEVPGAFDLVVANIGAAVLRGLAPELVARVRPGGRLLLAGLLAAQADDVAVSFTGAVEAGRVEELGWVAVELTVPSRSGHRLGELDGPVG